MRKLILACLIPFVLTACRSTQLRQPPEQPQPQAADAHPRVSPEAELRDRINQLLMQLSSREFKDRETAQAELAILLETRRGAVLAQLQNAYEATTDAEVKDRLERLLKPYTRWNITPAVLTAIPNIVELLEEDSRSSIRTAVEALRKLDIKDTREVLFAIMRNCEYGKRRTLEALVDDAGAEVIEFFISLLSYEEEDSQHGEGWRSEVTETAEYALIRIGRKAIPAVTRCLHEAESLQQRQFAANVLSGLSRQGRTILIESLRRGKADAKATAMRGLLEYAGINPPLDLLLELIKHEAAEVRALAAELLGEVGGARTVDALVSSLSNDREARVRAVSASALREIGDRRAVPALIKALKDRDESVRWQAARFFEYIEDERAVKPLTQVLEDPSRGTGIATPAFDALYDSSETAVPQILEAYKTAGTSVRIDLLTILENIGDRRAAPVLMDALKDANPQLRAAAAEALGCFEGGEETAALMAALKDTGARVRASAAFALGLLEAEEATDVLVAALKDSSGSVRGNAAQALGDIGNKRAVPALIEALEDSDHQVRYETARALAAIGDERAFEPLTEAARKRSMSVSDLSTALAATGCDKAIPYLVELLDTKYSADRTARLILRYGEAPIKAFLEAAQSDRPRRKANALKLLAMLREESAFEMLLQALTCEDVDVRLGAAEAISLYRDARAVEPLARLLGDKEDKVREKAAISLGALGDGRAVKPLTEVFLEDDDNDVRDEALAALGKIGDKASIELLIQALLEDNCMLRQSAALALARFKDPRIVSALIRTLEDENYSVRSHTEDALVKIGDKRMIAPLMEAFRNRVSFYIVGGAFDVLARLRAPETADFFAALLKEENDYCRGEPAFALAEIGDRRAIEPLRKLLKTRWWWVRLEVRAMLLGFGDEESAAVLQKALTSEDCEERAEAALALLLHPHPKALPWLLDAARDTNARVRDFALSALAKIEGEHLPDTLVCALKDEDSTVRKSAIEMLAESKEKRAVEPLIEILANDLDDDVREAAVEALGEITGQNFGWNYQKWRRWLEKQKKQEPQQKER